MLPYSDPKPQPKAKRASLDPNKFLGFVDPVTALKFGPLGGLVGGLIAGFGLPLLGLGPIPCLLASMGLGIGMGSALCLKVNVFRVMSAIMPGAIGGLLGQFVAKQAHAEMATLIMAFVIPAVFVGLLAGSTKRNMSGILTGAGAAAFGSFLAYGGCLSVDKLTLPPTVMIIITAIIFGALVAVAIAVALRGVKQSAEPVEPTPENKPVA